MPHGSAHDPKTASVIELITNPKRVKSELERERAARRGVPGWLGITPHHDEQAILSLDDGVTTICVHERSHAFRARLRTGFQIKDGIYYEGQPIPLEAFDARRLPAGTMVGVHYRNPAAHGRHSGEWLSTFFKLSKWPRVRAWETRPRIAHGYRVDKKDRAKFLAEMIGYLQEMIPAPRGGPAERRTGWFIGYAYLSFLVLVRDNPKRPGVWGRQVDTAKLLGISTRTVNDIVQMLGWFGVLRRISYPTPERSSNLYEITWPQRHLIARRPTPVPAPPPGAVRRVRV